MRRTIPYPTFRDWYTEYQQSANKENWSPKSKKRLRHRVFTDSTEKAAVDKWRETYYEKNLPSTGDDLCQIILQIHNNKYPERIVLEVSASTLMRIKQQYKVSSKRPVPRKRSTMAVDDSAVVH